MFNTRSVHSLDYGLQATDYRFVTSGLWSPQPGAWSPTRMLQAVGRRLRCAASKVFALQRLA